MTKILTPGGDRSKELMEKQNADQLAAIAKHKAKITRVVLEVEAILIREEFRWNDWNEVVNKFNDRNDYVMPRLTVKEIKERHDQLTR